MAFLNKIYVFIGLGVLIMALGVDGAITMPPTNRAVLIGKSNVTMSCASDAEDGYVFIGWSYLQVGSSSSVIISSGLNVMAAQKSYYAVVQSGSKQINLTILNTALARAGTYICIEGIHQESAQLVVINLRPANASSITGAKDVGHVYLGTTLTCTVDGNPPPSYSWLDVTYSNTTNNSAIKIWHDGEYRCTASNTVASTLVPINVKVYTFDASHDTTEHPDASRSGGGQTDNQNTIIGVVAGVGGALLIAAVAIVIYCRRKKKNRADRYSSGSEGTPSKPPDPPPPYDDNGHPVSQRSNDYPKDVTPESTTASEHQDRPPHIEDEGLNYAELQLDSNHRSGQPLQVAPEESTHSEVRLA